MGVMGRFSVAMVRMPVPVSVLVRMIVTMRVMVMILRQMDVKFCASNGSLLRAGAVKVIPIELKLSQFLFERRRIHS
jgi:hypothetical protein